jgi:hypothetical protein
MLNTSVLWTNQLLASGFKKCQYLDASLKYGRLESTLAGVVHCKWPESSEEHRANMTSFHANSFGFNSLTNSYSYRILIYFELKVVEHAARNMILLSDIRHICSKGTTGGYSNVSTS